jgi:hypothetical protein
VNISAQARVNNEEHDITGLMVSNDRDILQVLEGPLDNLNVLYGNIVKDSRHYQIEVLCFETIYERNFEKWRMKEINLSRYEGPLAQALSSFLIEDENKFFSHDTMKSLSLLSFIQATTSDR